MSPNKGYWTKSSACRSAWGSCSFGKCVIGVIVRHKSSEAPSGSGRMNDKRRATVERIAGAQLASMNGTMGDALGQSNRQRVVWLSLLAMPLLFPVALPGMASAVGAVCLLIAFGVLIGQPVPLPGWLARREINGRARALLERMLGRVVNVIALWGRPRLLRLSDRSARVLNGVMLSAAGLSMMVPVPIISFDNVLPALAIVLMSWGLRLRDGLMLVGGYLATLAAVVSVMLLWWGGASAAAELLSRLGLAAGQ